MGTHLRPPQKAAESPPQFSVHVYCGQTAGWIKVALGMDVGLCSGRIVLDEGKAPLPQKGRSLPILAHAIVAKRLGGLTRHLARKYISAPFHFVLDWFPAIGERGTAAPPPLFGQCLLWPRSPIAAIDELL